ncbi:hypothetical protein COO60DRAFT_1536282 [Scenedesmus sp. NREL 46B-D3]|nr:hypothetical protein COO60DRAFT_1536282 [Scenedesmus sp. NREL 46B-D3]
MTEQNAPKGEPYGQAVACLHSCTSLPAAVVIHPDHVLWPHSSESLAPEGFQLLEPASAVLSGLRAQQLSVALVVPSSSAQLVRSCLDQANMTAQFTAVVEFASDEQQQQQQQLQQQPPGRPRVSSSWASAANTLKAQLGSPWQQMLFFSADPLGVREASRLGMAAVKVSVTTGLDVSSLRAGLQVYGSKLESDRGY